MSPKKRRQRKPRRDHDRGAAPERAGAEAGQEPGTRGRVSRTPVVLDDPPDRRVTALWVVLALVWGLGSPLALAMLLFTTMDAAAVDPADPAAAAGAVDSIGTALIWLLVLALVVPAVSAVAAVVLRRRIAAIGFAVALAVSAGLIFWAMPPAELWDALRSHLSG
ncbi:hypothetical protein ACOQFV_11085 [Nocardiopsis changdeensis]|uniref:Uncharacterized protein n=1 Tax=Nocardiopsis changdeensis TaxID=2831969 RepID=A0ABX8BUU4_9ACTN|nr:MULTISPECIES: hypothetical protein [Nocardiopsis]QUX25480.1 hypothetical protein KGD84_15275 [Nocardiopsis changdeensis]QYX35866.1 hypothetical protein K1J57_24730 [Nocardiopsis sp. MT53]